MIQLAQPVHRPLCTDKRPMTYQRIIVLARQKGVFEVSWRYRDAALRKACRKLVKEGWLVRKKGPPGADYFALPPLRGGVFG